MPFDSITLNDGRSIPGIAFGTGSVWKQKDATPYVVQALEEGFTHVDTAQAYDNEESIPGALKTAGLSRERIWITTKYFRSPPHGELGVREELLRSLEKLETSYVDLYLIHSPRAVGDTVPDTWKEFEKVADEGLAKSVGVSNFTKPDLEELMKDAKRIPAVNQIQLNPYTLSDQQPALDYCRKHGIVVEAYSPLAPITRYPGGPVDEPVRQAAQRLKATPVQILLAWVRMKGAVVITTSSKSDRLREYLEAGDLVLTEEEISAIDVAGRKGPNFVNQGFTTFKMETGAGIDYELGLGGIRRFSQRSVTSRVLSALFSTIVLLLVLFFMLPDIPVLTITGQRCTRS